MLPYILASLLALSTFILRRLSQVEEKLCRKLVRSTVEFINNLVNREGLPFQAIQKGCTAIREVIANAAFESPRLDIKTGLPTYSHPQTQASSNREPHASVNEN